MIPVKNISFTQGFDLPAFAQMPTSGKMVSASMSSEILGQDREFAVYRPKIYESNPDKSIGE